MKKIPLLENLNEEIAQSEFDKLGGEITGALKNITLNNYLNVSKVPLGNGIYIRYRNGKDRSEWPNGIDMNDSGLMNFMIDEVNGKFVFEQANRSHQLKDPDTKINKKTGTYDQIKSYAINKLIKAIKAAQFNK